MRKIVVGLVVLLTVTGVAIAVARLWQFELPGHKVTSLVHIYAGFFFLVLFPLYAWDHINANRQWLRVPAMVTVSGAIQWAAALVLIVTGLLLLVYGTQVWPLARNLHHWLTYVLAASLALHYLSPKQ